MSIRLLSEQWKNFVAKRDKDLRWEKYEAENPNRVKLRVIDGGGIGGSAVGHSRRCVGTHRNTREQCKVFGLIGTNPPLCPMHGGVQRQRAQAGTYVIITRNLPQVYKRHLGPKLKDAVEQALGVDPDEQVSLYHELALMREYAGQYVAIYSAILEATGLDPVKRAEMIEVAGAGMKNALLDVAAICEKAGRLQEKSKERFSVHDLKFVIDKIMMIHYKVAGNQPELVRAFADAIDQQLTLPGKGDQGTDLHPDETAAMFDSFVPSSPENTDAQ